MPSSYLEEPPRTPVITVEYESYIAPLPGDGNEGSYFHSNGQRVTTALTERSLSKDWVRTPNYAALKAAGSLPLNPYLKYELKQPIAYSYTEVRTLGGEGNYSLIRERYPWQFPAPSYTAVGITRGDLDNAVLTKARAQKFSAPVFAAEFGKTAFMVKEAATTIYRTVKAIKALRFRDAAEVLGITLSKRAIRRLNRTAGNQPAIAAANCWLQLRYGWTPLLHDVHNAAEALAHTVSSREDSGDIRITKSGAGTLDTPWVELTTNSDNFPFRYKHRYTYATQWRSVWIMRPSNRSWVPTFGLDNPLEVAWELVPFSFVADWFLGVGDFLSALSFTTDYASHSYWLGMKVQNRHEIEDASVDEPGKMPSLLATCEGWRSIDLGPPPSATLSPRIENRMNATRTIDAIALLRQAFR